MVLEHTAPNLNGDLLDACRRGDPAAFRELFDLHKDKVYSIALRYTGDPGAAQDIAQDTFIKLFGALNKFRGDSSFESWLYRLVVNACFDHRRRERRLMPLVDSLLDLIRTPGANALDGMLRAETDDRIHAAVQSLPPDQRMAVVLRYTQSLSYEEIAAIVGCPPGTVASRLNRAHRTLEKRLTRNKGNYGRT